MTHTHNKVVRVQERALGTSARFIFLLYKEKEVDYTIRYVIQGFVFYTITSCEPSMRKIFH